MTPEQFVAHWADTHLKETASYITHFDDLCELVGHAKPAHMDKTGMVFTYQKGVAKAGLTLSVPKKRARRVQSDTITLPLIEDLPPVEPAAETQHGYADVWYRGHFAVEYKGAHKHKDLNAAFDQLLRYKDALENPPLLVVCDIEHFEIHTNFTNAVTRVYRFTNADIASNQPVADSRYAATELLRRLFYDPDSLKPEQTIEAVTEEAAAKFAALADSMHKKHHVPHAQAARFLVKLVFCLFCEDVGLLPRGIFSKIVTATKDSPDEFMRHIRDLFGAMAAGGRIVWGEPIYHFDGGLFADSENDPDVVPFDGADTRLLEDAAKLNWADVDPSIFGTLFERALDVEGKRAQLGAHYTSRADIETLVEPVLMAPLRREWEEVKQSAAGYLGWRSEARDADAQRAALEKLLKDFQEELATTTVLDPACGSGNFLYVSLSMLKDLEKQVITFGLDVGIPDLQPRVQPTQLLGIEKDNFAFQLASIVVWIGYLQWKVKNGYAPAGEQPILKPLDTIKQMDAILEISAPTPALPRLEKRQTGEGDDSPSPVRSADGGRGRGMGVNPTEPNWPPATVIVGNPPFLGGKRMRSELSDKYVDALFQLYEGRVPHEADLVCYWFEKARAMIADGKAQRAGLLATQGIRGGANREVLKRIKQSGNIFWAQSDRDWIQDGVAVHVSMVGFDDGTEKSHTLNDKPVGRINADLSTLVDLTQARQLKENMNIAFMGVTPLGPFTIPATKAREWLSLPKNPNKRSNSDVLRPFMNALDVTRRPRGVWIVDFGVDMSEDEAALYEAPFEYIRQEVKLFRAKAKSGDRTGVPWWLHQRPRPNMRDAIHSLKRYIVTPGVAKHRIFIWLENAFLPDHALFVFAFDDDFSFGILHSKVHELWARGTGTQLREAESGFRYTPTTCFETFPFPRPTEEQKEAIAEAARELNEKREHWLNPYKDEPSAIREDLKKRTLTNLYNERPTWLALAHEKLDHAVLDAYGWPRDLSDDDILARLLEENLKREPAGAKAEPTDDETEEPPKAKSAKAKPVKGKRGKKK